MAVQPSHYINWHTTGTVGTFGAAVATAVALGCDARQIAHAIATAATFAGGLQQAFLSDSMSKPLHPGHAADAGALAAIGAKAGVTGALDALHGPKGFAAATSEDTGKWSKAFADLGTRICITEMTFKNHGCCGHIFAALDAVRDLQREHGFTAEDVARIKVGGYGPTKSVCDRPAVTTEQEARFSCQYTIGALLVLGGVRIAAFEPENLAKTRIRAVMPKVTVELDPDLADAYPGKRAAKVWIDLADGRSLYRYQPTRKGDPDAPLTDAELSEKFLELVAPVIGKAAADALLDGLWRGDTVPGALPIPLRQAAE
jgi:2-methylcitrate dehydratase PrpD